MASSSQRSRAETECGAGRIRLGLCAGEFGAAASGSKDVSSSAGGLVPAFSGIPPYYLSRRHSSPAFALLVDALRYGRQRGGVTPSGGKNLAADLLTLD
jgi:hypothetical protein